MPKPGPRPLPDKVIEMRGRANKKAPRPEIKPDPGLPAPPPELPPRARAVWNYLAPELDKNALLTRRDREAFAFLCIDAAIAYYALRDLQPDRRKGVKVLELDESHDRTRRHPSLMAYRQAVESYRRWCAEFGLTPSSRVGMTGGLPSLPDDGDEDDDELFG